MKTNKPIKDDIKQCYSGIVLNVNDLKGGTYCCGGNKQKPSILKDEYNDLEGYNPDADLKLGCGLPTECAKIKKGDTVVDLGSGAGNDSFVARHEVGNSGQVIGIDFTEAMVEKARTNAAKLQMSNIEFRVGDIEDIPVENETADVVISNCVMNLVPNKIKAFSEVFRILKMGGHFSISDIVLVGDLTDKVKDAASEYVGCVSTPFQKPFYLQIINDIGFRNVEVQQEKPIVVPLEILQKHLTLDEIAEYNAKPTSLYSITVYAEKIPSQCQQKAFFAEREG